MKSQIAYGLVLIVMFVLVTQGLIYLNDQFKNIWEFDFEPVMTAEDAAAADSLALALQDSLDFARGIDLTDNQNAAEDTVETFTPEEIAEQERIAEEEAAIAEEEAEEQEQKEREQYLEWRKKTVKLYETMDPKVVAQVITEFPDNTARDLIYSMKRKKAAEVLANLTPEMVRKYTRHNN